MNKTELAREYYLRFQEEIAVGMMTKQELARLMIKECPHVMCKTDGHPLTEEEARYYVRKVANATGDNVSKEDKDTSLPKVLQQIQEQYSEKELQAIARGGRIMLGNDPVPMVSFNGQNFRFGVLGDTHIGSIYTDDNMIKMAFDEFKKEKCELVMHVGDVTEGMSNRPDHVYQCSQIGYTAQKQKAVELLSQWKQPIYMISGNHDRWYIKNSGADIVAEICDSLPTATYLGHDEGDISLYSKDGGVCTIKMFHGEDGSSYAHSYRIQKVVESFTGGEKPSILLLGHVHKSLYLYERHIHCISTGAIQRQSAWMRSKRLPAHTGFWIVNVTVNKKGVSRFAPTWYPFYN